MIKILIDNEEVLCDKNLTIDEQMLSTSSIILNNVYPKYWENDKDYVSRFYYPKDYSKCLIKDRHPKNWFDKDNINKINAYFENDITTLTSSNNNRTLYIECLPNTTYTFYKARSNQFWIGYTKELPAIGTTVYEMTKGPLGYNGQPFNPNNIVSASITTGEDAQYLVLRYYNVNNDRNKCTEQEVIDTIRIESEVEDLLFAGIVKNTGNISLNPRYPHYCNVQVLSFSDFLSTGDTLDFVISGKTVLEAIQMVIDTVSEYGFVLGNVNIIGADDVIGAYSTLNKTAYDVFQYLADITQSRWTTRMVDENTVAIDFYDPSLMPVGTEIDYTNEWFENNCINDMRFNYGTYDYRNKQVMLSDEVYADIDYTETVIGDGYNKTFLTSSNIAVMKSILVNGVEASFATKEDKEYGVDADFYYELGKNEIESDTTYTSGTVITVTYTPLVQGRQVVYNSAEVSRITNQLDRRGIIARYENRNDVLSSDELNQIGQSYIKFKGYPEINLTVDTLNNIWEIGQTVFFNAPLTELNTDYMVKSKKILIIPTINEVFYTYTLTSSFNSENEINYFDNQRSKNSGNINVGDYITRNIDIENVANIIFSNLTVTEITVDGDNVLDSALDSPFID